MRVGKVSDSILKRSVLKQIRTKRDEIIKGAGVGEDCAFFSCAEGIFTTCVSEAAVAEVTDMGRLMTKATNNLAASMSEPIAVLLTIVLPESAEEPYLKSLMAAAEKEAQKLKLQIAGGHTTVSSYVSRPIVTITAYGKSLKNEKRNSDKVNPGTDLVVSKWIGLEGSYLLAESHKENLLQRYPSHLVDEVLNFSQYFSVIPEALIAMKEGAVCMHDVSEGGVFAALWEMAERCGRGLSIDLRKLPIRQETVEVCERLERNPYELLGGGSLLIACEDGEKMVEALQQAGISATVVGKFTDSNDKLIYNEDEKRYMDRPAIDQVYE